MKQIKKLIFFISLLLAAASGTAIASDGTITFNGSIIASTCAVTLNGASASGTVDMSDVALSQLTIGKTAGQTNFTLNLTGCTAVTGMTTVNAFFEAGAGVDVTTGNLINTGTATNVSIQLLVADTMEQIIPGSFTQAQPTSSPVTAGTIGTLAYVAQYISTGTVTAGTIVSSVTYSLVYN